MADKVVVKKKTTVRRRGRSNSRSRGRSRSRSRTRTKKTIKIVEKTPAKSILKKELNNLERRDNKRFRKLEKKVNGPKIHDRMAVTTTLGVLTGNSENNLERKMRALLNPLLLKSQNTGSSASPLSLRASQYSMWKIQKCVVKFVPLVGAANVAGSVTFVCLDQDATSSQPESPDTIKAKVHAEVSIGQRYNWNVHPRYLVGPRSGWWGMDTGESPTDTVGPALDFWNLYKTVNTLQTGATQQAYTAPLFSIEVFTVYVFSGYEPKPALATMTNTTFESQQGATITNGANGELQLNVPKTSSFAERLREKEAPQRGQNQTGGVGEVLWAVASGAVEGAAEALGPWGWLLRGGWWVIKKFFGRSAENANDVYLIYSSIEDANKDSRIYQQVTGTAQVQKGPLVLTQISSPNVNQSGGVVQVGSTTVTDYLPLPQAQVPLLENILYDITKQPVTSTKSHTMRLTGFPASKWVTKTSNDWLGTSEKSVQAKKWLMSDYTDTGVIFGFPYTEENPGATHGNVGVIHTAESLIKTVKYRKEHSLSLSPFETTPLPTTSRGPTEMRGCFDTPYYWCRVCDNTRWTKPTNGAVTNKYDAWGLMVVSLNHNKVYVLVGYPDSATEIPAQQLVWDTFNWDDPNFNNGRKYFTDWPHTPPLHDEEQEDPDDDDLSDVTSLFEQAELGDETDFKFNMSIQTSKHLEEEKNYWKNQCERLMMEKALSGTAQPLVRFEKAGPRADQSSASGHT
uniref:Capsid protein n=1 Tax=Avastrovirus guineafowl/ITA/2010/Bari-ELVA TaxID=1176481 RepID=M9NKA3_9VIRU|nr:capsid protein [Avastrovirus guineafowl/ITA/2010/Bari-ELVA]